MTKHAHARCDHRPAWCRHCDVVYCEQPGCTMEWRPPCTQVHAITRQYVFTPLTPNPWGAPSLIQGQQTFPPQTLYGDGTASLRHAQCAAVDGR